MHLGIHSGQLFCITHPGSGLCLRMPQHPSNLEPHISIRHSVRTSVKPDLAVEPFVYALHNLAGRSHYRSPGMVLGSLCGQCAIRPHTPTVPYAFCLATLPYAVCLTPYALPLCPTPCNSLPPSLEDFRAISVGPRRTLRGDAFTR